MKNQFQLTALSLALMLPLMGCLGGDESNMNNLEDEGTAQEALSDPFAIFGTNDEDVEFSDEAMAEIDGEELAYADPFSDSIPSLNALHAASGQADGCETNLLRLRWGHFRDRANLPEAATDWSGTVSVNTGTLILVSTVAFDREDSIVDRDDRQVIAFVSKTLPHFDGLRLKYRVCPSDLEEEPVLTFDSPEIPFSKSYSVSDLAYINDLVEDVHGEGTAFQLQSTLKTSLCRGDMRGHWVVPAGAGALGMEFGVIRGALMAENGIRVGHMKGVFGENEEGERKWAAKIVTRRGRFQGIAIGTYGEGAYEGTVYHRREDAIGTMEGRYFKAERGRRGTFSGFYDLECARSEMDDDAEEGEGT